MTELFSRICEILFVFDDSSTILCTTTLNQEILEQYGFGAINGFVDLSSGKIIPEDLFDNNFEILPSDVKANQSELDSLFNIGGKIHWKSATY